MCKYCDNTFGGEANEVLLDTKLAVNGVDLLFMSTYICDIKSKLTLKTKLETLYAEVVASEEVEIQYCPVCGRKLV